MGVQLRSGEGAGDSGEGGSSRRKQPVQGPEAGALGVERKEPVLEVGCSSLGEFKGHRKETGFCPSYNLNWRVG